MNPQEQIKALAELAGYKERVFTEHPDYKDKDWTMFVPDYLYSYDAIIPLIQKQPTTVQLDIVKYLYQSLGNTVRHTLSFGNATKLLLMMTPQQLSEALLRATGKWKDEG